ncbi:hypothetical protein IL306_005887 [Fusarium sp. DS 682]|nr:hypothetical protein IL306_005887 [Fusarium sp. DS 682]
MIRNEDFGVGGGEDKWTSSAYCINDVSAIPGTGKIQITSDVYSHGIRELKGFLLGVPVAVVRMYATSHIGWTATITLQAIENGGDLDVKVTTDEPKVESSFDGDSLSVLDKIPLLKNFGKALQDKLEAARNEVPALVKDHISKFMAAQNTAKQLSDALNGQGRFIFPGGGTFDMKDPIFSNNGDVLIGLSYRQGKDRSA